MLCWLAFVVSATQATCAVPDQRATFAEGVKETTCREYKSEWREEGKIHNVVR